MGLKVKRETTQVSGAKWGSTLEAAALEWEQVLCNWFPSEGLTNKDLRLNALILIGYSVAHMAGASSHQSGNTYELYALYFIKNQQSAY